MYIVLKPSTRKVYEYIVTILACPNLSVPAIQDYFTQLSFCHLSPSMRALPQAPFTLYVMHMNFTELHHFSVSIIED